MAHFANLDEDNLVTQVIVVDNNDILDEQGNESEEVGIQFCKNLFGTSKWKQTSYNTRANEHPKGNPFRKNYAGIGYTYDEIKDAFIPPQPFPSWELCEETYLWQSPVPHPNDGKNYIWNEELINWELVE